MVFVEIMVYGDFDIQQTDSIWCGEGPIPPFDRCENTNKTEDVEKYIKELKKNGFKKVKTVNVKFGGNC